MNEASDRLASLKLADFSQRIGSVFSLSLEDGSGVELELVEAKSLALPGSPKRARDPFSLLLRGPADIELPQRIYALEHAELGELPLFLVPVAKMDDGLRYQAVFS